MVSDRIWQAPEHLEAWRQGFIAGEHDRMQPQPAKRPPGMSNEPAAAEQRPSPFRIKDPAWWPVNPATRKYTWNDGDVQIIDQDRTPERKHPE